MNRKWKISQYCENPPRFDLSRCQDACASYEDGELFVMALCDGAPAASLSHIGAACIAEFSAKYFAEHFDTLYDAEFNVACEELIKYHQAMISNLAEVAAEKKDVKILINRMIQLRELNKFSSTVQILAVKGENAIYFKVGNGSAVVASPKSVLTLSDSLVRDPVAYVTIPNPVNLLISCDFQRFTVSPSCYAIALATDGIEFDGGLFFNQKATHFYEKALEDIVACEDDVTTELQTLADLLLCDHKNTEKDNIGISVLHRECLPEPVVPPQEADEDVRIMIMEEPAGEEPKTVIVEEPAGEEPKAVIVEEPAGEEPKEEPKAEIVEEPAGEEPKAVTVEEPVKEEPKAVIVEEPAGEEPKAVIVEEPAGEEPGAEIADDANEPEFEIVDDEEPESEIADDAEEPEFEIVDDEEPSSEITEGSADEKSEIETTGGEEASDAEAANDEEEPEFEIVDDEEEPEFEIVDDDGEPEFEIVDDDEEVPDQIHTDDDKQAISKTILKFFNVSIKKK